MEDEGRSLLATAEMARGEDGGGSGAGGERESGGRVEK